MSSTQHTNCCCLSKSNNFNEHGWVMQIRRIIDEEIEDDGDGDVHVVSIFNVPKTLKDTNPNAYTPMLVALGPYHYFRPETQEMERFKLSSARRFQNQSFKKLEKIVHRLMMLDHRIRACYHKHLDINGETLAWMMAIDAVFLIEIGEIYSNKERKMLAPIPSKLSHLMHWTRRKSSHNAILRDIIMLENQIPLFVLREMLEFRLHSSNMVDKTLTLILLGLCKDLSPFNISNWDKIQPSECDHILDFLYQNMVPKLEETIEINENVDQDINSEERKLCKLLSKVKDFLGQIPLKVVFKLPWIFICSLPGFTILMTLFSPKDNHQDHFNNPQSIQESKPPSIEEIMIPSIFELSKSGVTFLPINGDIMSISFDTESKKFYIPVISIDVNTETVLRNLVAYEASSATSSSLVFARYIELMNGIIDTKDDVKLLRERGIVVNYMKSDEEVANLWNGMSKSLRMTRVAYLDEIIENVNRCYNRNWKIILIKIMTTYIINSWQILASLVVALILFLLLFQVSCSFLYGPNMVDRQPRGRG